MLDQENSMTDSSFSFQELREARKVEVSSLEWLVASDGVRLAYRRYSPRTPVAAVLFYHGGGAHRGAGYQFIGNSLQSDFNMVVYTPDIRGHGSSGGERA
jgi:acylglycerol lipase